MKLNASVSNHAGLDFRLNMYTIRVDCPRGRVHSSYVRITHEEAEQAPDLVQTMAIAMADANGMRA